MLLLVSTSAYCMGPITGPSTICRHETGYFTDTASGGTWSTTSSIISIVSTSGGANITGLAAGTAVITYTIGASFDTAILTVYPTPVISITGRDTICPGVMDTLAAHDSLSGYMAFVWHGGGLSCYICDTNIVVIHSTVIYSVYGTNTYGCSDSTNFTLNVFPIHLISVSPSPAIVCKDSTIQLVASGAASYTWFPASGLSCTSCPNPTATGTASTNYFVAGINTYGCRDTTAVPLIVDTCTTGIPQIGVAKVLNLYPNPATNEFIISGNYRLTSIAIINCLGQLVYMADSNANEVTIDVANLIPGIYAARINNEAVRLFRKE